MTQTSRIIIQLCLWVAATMLYGCSSPVHVEESSVERISIDDLNFSEGAGEVIASYNDFSDSLSSLKEKAALIVRGKVAGYSPTKVGVITHVVVSETCKGNSFDSVHVYQLGKVNEDGTIIGDVLHNEGEYILFLGLQNGAGENAFYITGGMQGAFQVESNGKLVNKDPTMQNELAAISEYFQTDPPILSQYSNANQNMPALRK